MLRCLLLIASLVVSLDVHRIKGEESKEGSGYGNEFPDDDVVKDVDGDDDDFEMSGGGGVSRESIPGNKHQPPSGKDYEDGDIDDGEDDDLGGGNGGAGIVFDGQDKDDSTKPEDDKHKGAEPVSVNENNLLSHPAVIAAIVVGGFLVLVCLVIFFVLIVCCVRKKDEGTYNLDKAMKEKLQYITYTKADPSEKEFFA